MVACGYLVTSVSCTSLMQSSRYTILSPSGDCRLFFVLPQIGRRLSESDWKCDHLEDASQAVGDCTILSHRLKLNIWQQHQQQSQYQSRKILHSSWTQETLQTLDEHWWEPQAVMMHLINSTVKHYR